MPNPFRTLLVFVALALPAVAAPAQHPLSPADRLLAARKLYYTPTAQGLKSFRCNATVDWKAMLMRLSGSPVADDNPFLVYLKSVRFTVSDNLNGEGSLTWTDTTTPPANLQKNRDQMRNGLMQIIDGYYQSWNQFVNGGMVSAPDSSTTETATADGGVHMHGGDATSVFDREFDRNMLLLSTHFVNKELDNTSYPTYEASTDGLRVSRVRHVLHQPPTAPARVHDGGDLHASGLVSVAGHAGRHIARQGVRYQLQQLPDQPAVSPGVG